MCYIWWFPTLLFIHCCVYVSIITKRLYIIYIIIISIILGIYRWSLSSPLIINWCQIWLHNTDVKSIQMTESHLSYLRILSSAICLEIIFFKKIEKNKSKSKKQTVLICSFENLRAITNWRKTMENQWRFSLYYDSVAHGFFV